MATRSVIRRLWAGERDQVREHLLRLDSEDRVLRFGGYESAAQIAAYCERLDWSRVVVVGYLMGGEARGLGQLELIRAGRPSCGGGRGFRGAARSNTAASGRRCCAAWSSQRATA
jgi:hypothetical protein